MHIRVALDVCNPLKRRMKIKKPRGDWCWINFKYDAYLRYVIIMEFLDIPILFVRIFLTWEIKMLLSHTGLFSKLLVSVR